MCNNSIGQVNLLSTYCATFNTDTGYIETGECIYNEGHIHEQLYTALPSNVSELNEFTCGKLFNRTGTLCGECKDGHYPLVYSFDMNCVECPNGNSNWWKFLLVAFLPLTIFFYVIFICRVNITSSALFGFVHCQMAFDPGSIKLLLLATTNTHNVQKMLRLVGTFLRNMESGFLSLACPWYMPIWCRYLGCACVESGCWFLSPSAHGANLLCDQATQEGFSTFCFCLEAV